MEPGDQLGFWSVGTHCERHGRRPSAGDDDNGDPPWIRKPPFWRGKNHINKIVTHQGKAGRFFVLCCVPLSFCCCFCCLFQGSIELWTSKLLAAELLSAQFSLSRSWTARRLSWTMSWWQVQRRCCCPTWAGGLEGRVKGIGFKEWLQLVKTMTHILGWSLGCWTFGHVGISHDSDPRPTRPKEETNRLFCRSNLAIFGVICRTFVCFAQVPFSNPTWNPQRYKRLGAEKVRWSLRASHLNPVRESTQEPTPDSS